MVNKKVNAKTLMNIFFGAILIVILGAWLISAATAFAARGIVAGGNYSTNILLNVTTGMNHTAYSYNTTFYYNASGGDAYLNSTFNNLTGTLWNETVDDDLFNITIDVTTVLGGLTDARTYNISARVDNGTDQSLISLTNITLDSTPPRVNFSDTTSVVLATNDTLVNNGNYSAAKLVKGFNINVSYSDAIFINYSNSRANIYINLSNASGGQTMNFTRALNLTSTGVFFNITLNMTNASQFPDGKYNITIYANDTTSIFNSSGDLFPNINDTERIQITVDRTAPSSVTLAQHAAGTTRTEMLITITAADATSGINTCSVDTSTETSINGTGTTTQYLLHTGLNCGTSYSYIVACADQAGNSLATAQTSFSTDSCSDGSSGGGGNGGVNVVEKVNVFTTIIPETPVTLSNFEEGVGVDKIIVTVKEEVANAKITVRKFDTQPAEITVSKSGNVHRYLQITSENLVNKLQKAIVTIKVQKNWLLDNNIDKANIALFKLDESAGKWNELSTIYKSEDDDYYYYDAEVTSFSYFTIAEKVAEEEEEEEEEAERNLLWLWILIGVVVVGAIIGGGFAIKRRR